MDSKIVLAPPRTITQERELLKQAAVEAIKQYNKRPITDLYEIRYEVSDLIEFFPAWKKDHRKKQLSKWIRNGMFGKCDREGRPTATIREFHEFLFKHKSQ